LAAGASASDYQDAAPLPPARRRRRRWPWVVAALVVLLAGGGGAAYALTRDTTPSEQVPLVRSHSLDDARQLAAAAHLRIRVASQPYDETAPAGTILDQNPPAPATLKQGRSIAVVVSNGPAPRPVPDVGNVDQATADKRLRDAGFVPSFTPQSSETVGKGTVLGYQPQGTQPKSTTINVVVSSGPAPVQLSDWAGHTFDELTARVAPLNIKVARKDAYSDTVPAGKIISTDPAPGAMLPRDGSATVTATVSKGFQPLPDVGGKSVGDATNILTAAGYQVVGVQGSPNKAVTGTNPPAGTPAKKGTQVTLVTG
jgi:serine/threonine-protein kinase